MTFTSNSLAFFTVESARAFMCVFEVPVTITIKSVIEVSFETSIQRMDCPFMSSRASTMRVDTLLLFNRFTFIGFCYVNFYYPNYLI